MHYNHQTAANIIYACTTLHNFLIENSFDIGSEINVSFNRSGDEDEEPVIDEGDIDFRSQNIYLSHGKVIRDQLIIDSSFTSSV